MLPVSGLVDLEVGAERQQVGGHAALETEVARHECSPISSARLPMYRGLLTRAPSPPPLTPVALRVSVGTRHSLISTRPNVTAVPRTARPGAPPRESSCGAVDRARAPGWPAGERASGSPCAGRIRTPDTHDPAPP